MVKTLEKLAGKAVPSVKDVEPLRVILVRTEEQRQIWSELMRSYHYLSPQGASMGTFKYLVYGKGAVLAALSFAGAGYKLKPRDQLLQAYGLSRSEAQGRLIVNSRFLIVPYVRVQNLASAILSRVIKQTVKDWEERFGQKPLLVETFVDPEHFRGTSYRAANWLFWGYTRGSGKRGKGYVQHGRSKAIFIYPLTRGLRDLMLREGERIVGRRAAMPGSKEPGVDPKQWAPHPLLTETAGQEATEVARILVEFHREFSGAFGRRRQEQLSLSYLAGLLGRVKRKNIENIAEELMGPQHIRSMQRFLKNSPWDEELVRAKFHQRVCEEISEADAMLAVDPSEFAKRGTESVGVTRQYCGNLGKVDNCQSGVFAGYVSRKGYCLVDARLYLPQSWFAEGRRSRWEDWDIPANTRFMTKPQIAIELIQRIWQEGRLPFRWVGCDSFLGRDIDLLERLPDGVWFLAQVPSDTPVWLEEPSFEVSPYKGRGRKPSRPKAQQKPSLVHQVAERGDLPWRVETLCEGSQGPVKVRLLILRVWLSHSGLAKGPYWLIIRQSLDGKETKFYLSNAPESISREELKRAVAMRWRIEQCFRLAKTELGMAHYETRSWIGWHRHMLYVQLAFLLLLILRRHFKKNSTAELTSSQSDRCLGYPPAIS